MYFMSISTFSSFFMNLQNLLNMVFMSYYHLFDGFTRFLFSFSREAGRRDCFSSFYYTTTCWDSVVRDAPAAAEGKEWPHTLPHTTSCATACCKRRRPRSSSRLSRPADRRPHLSFSFPSPTHHVNKIDRINRPGGDNFFSCTLRSIPYIWQQLDQKAIIIWQQLPMFLFYFLTGACNFQTGRRTFCHPTVSSLPCI